MIAFFAPRLWRMLVLPAVIFGVLSYGTNDRALILVLNIIQFGLGVAVVTAFTSEVWHILTGCRDMTRGSWMAYGIWLGWGAVAWQAGETLVW